MAARKSYPRKKGLKSKSSQSKRANAPSKRELNLFAAAIKEMFQNEE